MGFVNAFILVGCTATFSFFNTFLQYWLKWWTEADASRTAFFISGYIVMALMAWVATSGIMWTTLILVAPRSGRILHQRLLHTIFG